MNAAVRVDGKADPLAVAALNQRKHAAFLRPDVLKRAAGFMIKGMTVFVVRHADSFARRKDDFRSAAADALRIHQQRRFAAQIGHVLQHFHIRGALVFDLANAQQIAVFVKIIEPVELHHVQHKAAGRNRHSVRRIVDRNGEHRFAQRVDPRQISAAGFLLSADDHGTVFKRHEDRRCVRCHALDHNLFGRFIRAGLHQQHARFAIIAVRHRHAPASVRARRKARFHADHEAQSA